MFKKNNLIILLLGLFMLVCGCGSKKAAVDIKAFEDLGNEGVKIAIGEPESVPVGKYTMMILEKLDEKDEDLKKNIEKNIITEEPNVKAVIDKVVTKEVDAGFVYLTDAYQEKENVEIINIPEDINLTPKYPVAILNESEKKDIAQLFVDYLTSKEGVAILEKYGFSPTIENPKEFTPESFEGETLVVYAAASMTESFEEIAQNIKDMTGTEIKFKFASSGSLRQLIENGAASGPEGADIFASASLDHMQSLKNEGFVEDFDLFTENKVVVVVPK